MTELEHALVALGREVDFPATPDLGAAVRPRIARPSRRRWLVVAVALAVVALGIAMAVPPARSAILRFFHIGAVTVERVETLPPAEERPLAAGLGPPLSRAQAEARSGLRIQLPEGGRYYARPGLVATLIEWQSKPVLVAQLSGNKVDVAKKLASEQTIVEPVQLGDFGIWIEGAPHIVRLGRDARLAGNVLVWLEGRTTFRLEGDLDKGQMLELARDITR
jgi:hypothetical protein